MQKIDDYAGDDYSLSRIAAQFFQKNICFSCIKFIL
ncbi:MAG: hypothetical protein HUJ74_00800 [Lachnospiraceae bacterium]|nr:hypothetical protein [Lachnospiraceae bacterium]